MKGKKAQNITITTIVIIVLALIVLVVLVLGFTGGWSNLWTRISSFFGGANVDSVVQACQVACTTEAQNDYCVRMRNVKFGKDSGKVDAKYNCKKLEVETDLEPCEAFADETICPYKGPKGPIT